MWQHFFTILCLVVFLAACSSNDSITTTSADNILSSPLAQPTPDQELQKQISEIAKEAKGKVGFYAVLIETGEAVSLNADERFAMQSVVKLPISMAVMQLVADEKFSLDSKVKIEENEYVPTNMRSPLRDSKTTEISLIELIRYAISESDGTASDVLQRVAGNAKGVQNYIASRGIREMKVKYTHKEFGVEWKRQYENLVTPNGAIELLKTLLSDAGINEVQEIHSVYPRKDKADLLLKFMTESNNPPNRIVAGVPKGTLIAHKTGTGGALDGITSATNDVGIITLPNGNHIAIAVFVGDSKADLATREGVIANITKVIFDKWNSTKTIEPVKSANFTERHSLH